MAEQAPASEVYQISEAQMVGVGVRFLAVLIDGIIIGIVGSVLTGILGSHQALLAGGLNVLLNFIYFIVLEATRGATLGKMALGLRVVRFDGSSISWSESIIRNLLRIIDVLPIAYLVGAILIWTSSRKQRLGDRFAHTIVIKRR